MRVSTAFNIQERICSRLNGIYRTATIFKLSSKQIIERTKNEIWEDEGLKRCPGHVKSYISGFHRAIYENHWNNVTWVLPFNGVNYEKWDDLPEEGKEEYRTGKGHGKHVYKSDMISDF